MTYKTTWFMSHRLREAMRYSNRAELGVDDEARVEKVARGIVSKRLVYRDSSERQRAANVSPE